MDEKKKEVLGKQWLHEAWGWIVRHMSTTPREMLRGLVAALIAFLLANCELPFSVYPLGLAFLCASTEGTLYIMAGLVAASFTLPLPRALSLCVAVGTVIIRILARVFIDLPNRIGGDGRRGEIREYLRGRMFCEGLYLRMACSCVSVFAMSLGAIVGGGFRYYDLFGALLSMVMAPMAVRLFSGVFSGETDSPFSGRMAVAARHLSHVSVCAALCL